jgi:hypothetical protein
MPEGSKDLDNVTRSEGRIVCLRARSPEQWAG